jgi:outer membrane protein OmpA-like peptidoglycan-associated protein
MIGQFVRTKESTLRAPIAMIDRASRRLKGPLLPAGVVAAALSVAAGEATALPLAQHLPRASSFLLVQEPANAAPAPAASGELRHDAPLAELNAALAAAQAKLEQLNRAAEAVAGAAALRAALAAKEEENRGLRAELASLRARSAEWQRAHDAAQAESAGLAQALADAAAEAKQLDGELAAVRWQNAQLGTSLELAQAGQEAARAETDAVRTELSERVDALLADAESSTAEIGRLTEDLAAAKQGRDQIAGRAVDLQKALDAAGSDLDRMRGQLGATTARLNEVNAALSAAEQERDTALGGFEDERARTARLRDALAVAEADVAQAKAANRDLETRLAGLEEAAMLATDAARQNLMAVEHQIAALSSTLAEADLAPPVTPAAAAPAAKGAGAANGVLARDPEPAAGQAPSTAAERALITLAARGTSKSLAELTAELPVENRIQAQSLLADLEAETEPQGMKLMVPGAELFTTNGREVRDAAYDSLAKVAELINLYKSQPVLIIGHTDAVGAPDYNQTLSERRAGLVRQFFIDHFDVAAARLSTQGMGEQHPIASNATAAGRRANRRVEVLILN